MTQTTNQLKQVVEALKKVDINQTSCLLKQQHGQYMKMMLMHMGKAIIHFDYGQPWIYYYIVSTLIQMKMELPEDMLANITKAIRYCWNVQCGGFGGGYMQLPHLAPTYSAFLTILNIGPSAYHLLDRQGLTKFFRTCKIGGRFQMTKGAETDLRAAYIVTIIVKLLHLDQQLLEGVAETILAAQTYEGGLSNIEGGQAHGGYTFCGIATLSVLGRLHEIDLARLTLWLSRRQCDFGGFNGRTNKLLDSCYSFWVGAIFNIVNNYFGNKISHEDQLIYSQEHLQNYITFYCQDIKGGLKDKPGKNRDIYHTWYSLSGLSLSQEHFCAREGDRLVVLDPVYNVEKERMQAAREYFMKYSKK